MMRLDGIQVREVTVTFLDGFQHTWRDVTWLRQADGVTLQLTDGRLVLLPLHTIRMLEWQVAEEDEA